MRRTVALGALLTLALSIVLTAQSAQELYQRALVQEHANGNLTDAIALYAQALQTAGKDRALAAKVLMRIAGAHEKLGATIEAEKAYAELLRVYPEQRAEVALAQERLKALRRVASVNTADRTVPLDLAPDLEVAARVATFLWGSVPDAQLLDAARRGNLHDSAALNRQVLRMLRDARSASLVDNFFSTWLSLDRVKTARPDPTLFPEVDSALLQAMDTETRLFLQSQLREDRDAVELWTAPYTYVNDRLARHYGLSGISGRNFRRVTWPNANRAGILGQAGPLTALSHPTRTSPTARGMYVLSRFLGTDAPAPPANIAPLGEPSPGTMRQRMMAHRTNPSCANCHAMFDPFGLALENFDATGAWRTADGGAPIDASGALPDGTRFTGPAELRAALLLKYREAYYTNVTRQLLAYALNRKKAGRVYDYEMAAVRKIVRDASAQGYRWSAILTGISASAPFQMKEIVP
jgi:hypothetical protein